MTVKRKIRSKPSLQKSRAAKIDTETKRWIRSAADEMAVRNGCRFKERLGLHVVEFFETQLRQNQGEWDGECLKLMDWQRDDLILPLFGWVDATGRRRYRVAYVEVPKKNGKSTIAAGIALYLLAADGEPGAQVFCAASNRDQAGIVYREASAMAKAAPLLRDYIVPSDSQKNLAIPSANAFLRVISSDHYSAQGLNIHGLIFDELWAQPTRDLWDALRYGGAARRQPMTVAITTAGWDRNSICYEIHQRARRSLNGKLEDDTFFAYIRSAGETDDWREPDTWRKANPSLGVIIDEARFAQECREAEESSDKENSFKMYRLNIWAEQAVRWVPMEKWDLCPRAASADLLRGRACFGGLDLSSTQDITALVLAFPRENGGYYLLPYFWIPEEGAHGRERRDGVPYRSWAQQGLVELVPGAVVNYDLVRAKINALAKEFSIQDIGVDPHNATQITRQLLDDGIQMLTFRQGMLSMNAPSKEFHRLVTDGVLDHGGNPVLRWMAENVAVESDAAGNIKPVKDIHVAQRIDGIVASVMAIGRAMVTECVSSEPAFIV